MNSGLTIKGFTIIVASFSLVFILLFILVSESLKSKEELSFTEKYEQINTQNLDEVRKIFNKNGMMIVDLDIEGKNKKIIMWQHENNVAEIEFINDIVSKKSISEIE